MDLLGLLAQLVRWEQLGIQGRREYRAQRDPRGRWALLELLVSGQPEYRDWMVLRGQREVREPQERQEAQEVLVQPDRQVHRGSTV